MGTLQGRIFGQFGLALTTFAQHRAHPGRVALSLAALACVLSEPTPVSAALARSSNLTGWPNGQVSEEDQATSEQRLAELISATQSLPSPGDMLLSLGSALSDAELLQTLRNAPGTVSDPERIRELQASRPVTAANRADLAHVLDELEASETAGDRHDRVIALCRAGSYLWRSGRYQEAEQVGRKALVEALELQESEPHTWLLIEVYEAWTKQTYSLDRRLGTEATKRLLPPMLEYCGAADNGVLSHVNSLAMGYVGAGDLVGATEVADVYLELTRELTGDMEFSYGAALRLRATLHFMEGEGNQAEGYLWRAISIMRRSPTKAAKMQLNGIMGDLASLRFSQGDIDEAVMLFRESLEGVKAMFDPGHPFLAEASLRLANMLTKQKAEGLARSSQLAEARSLIERALEIFQAQGMRTEKLAAEFALTELIQNQDLQSGERITNAEERALELERVLLPYADLQGAFSYEKSLVQVNLAMRLIEANLWDSALHYAREAQLVLSEKRFERTAPNLFAEVAIGWAEYRLGNLDSAMEWFERSAKTLDAISVQAAQGQRRSTLFDQLGALNAAAIYINCCADAGRFERVAGIAERSSGRALLELAQRSERDLVAELSARDLERADELRALSLQAEQVREAIVELQQRHPDGGAESADSQAANSSHADQLEARFRELRELDDRLQTGLSELWPTAAPTDLNSIRAQLGPREAILYLVGGTHAASAVLCPPADQPIEQSRAWPLANNLSEVAALQSSVEQLRGWYSSPPERRGKRDSQSTWEELGQLESLLPILRSISQRYETVTVVSNGFFEGLPLHLVDPNPSLHLGYCTSGSLLAQLRLRDSGLEERTEGPVQEPGRTKSRALLLGDPSFMGQADSDIQTRSENYLAAMNGLPALPGTREEVRSIAELFHDADLAASTLLGLDASLPQLEDALTKTTCPRWLHLATHGLLGTRRHPEHAGLALVMPGQPSSSNPGFLTLDHMLRSWRQQLAQCELVVLSSCDGQVGNPAGNTNMALSWGFFYAGASSVLASHWKVDDRATAYLMLRFYENLLGRFEGERSWAGGQLAAQQPASKIAALHEAQAWLKSATLSDLRSYRLRLSDKPSKSGQRNGAGNASNADTSNTDSETPPSAPQSVKPYSDPYYWAAFTLLGNPE